MNKLKDFKTEELLEEVERRAMCVDPLIKIVFLKPGDSVHINRGKNEKFMQTQIIMVKGVKDEDSK